MIFKDEDSGLADNCLAHARDLYDFAINYKAKYSDSSPQGWFLNKFYHSNNLFGKLPPKQRLQLVSDIIQFKSIVFKYSKLFMNICSTTTPMMHDRFMQKNPKGHQIF